MVAERVAREAERKWVASIAVVEDQLWKEDEEYCTHSARPDLCPQEPIESHSTSWETSFELFSNALLDIPKELEQDGDCISEGGANIPEQSVIGTESEGAGKPFNIEEDDDLDGDQSGDYKMKDDIPIASDKEEARTLSTTHVLRAWFYWS